MNQGNYYAIVTKRFRLRSNHDDWLSCTQDFYNKILLFYYELFLQQPELQGLSSQAAMRQLEKLTIIGRDKQPVPNPLPWKKVPLYFRRAAINAAIAAGRSFLSRKEQQVQTSRFSEAVTFYKGMYQELTEKGIDLKVWTGTSWQWMHCRLTGNRIQQEEQPMSPSVILHQDYHYLDIPVKVPVMDRRTAMERIKAGEGVCSVQFTNRDAMAVCCILQNDGSRTSVLFIRGGKKYAHDCRQLLEKIRKSEAARKSTAGETPDKKYWMKLKHLNEYHSHRVSKQILDYCQKQGVSILVLPDYQAEYHKMILKSVGNWSPLHLSTQIRDKLSYKAWKAGILILEVNPADAGSSCAVCQSPVRKQGTEILCAEGHQGDRDLNFATNLGRKCLNSVKSK